MHIHSLFYVCWNCFINASTLFTFTIMNYIMNLWLYIYIFSIQTVRENVISLDKLLLVFSDFNMVAMSNINIWLPTSTAIRHSATWSSTVRSLVERFQHQHSHLSDSWIHQSPDMKINSVYKTTRAAQYWKKATLWYLVFPAVYYRMKKYRNFQQMTWIAVFVLWIFVEKCIFIENKTKFKKLNFFFVFWVSNTFDIYRWMIWEKKKKKL